MTEETRLKMLQKPTGIVDIILDTDAYNEVDDQYAISYMVKAPEKLNPVAIYAAPFFNQNSTSPEDGMLRSYDEILKISKMAGWDHPENVFRGSRTYLPDEHTPVVSPAAEDLARRAMNYTSDAPLYVACIGAITNVASALLLNPEIRERIVVIWVAGHSFQWDTSMDFNMRQDVPAARVVMGCGVPLVLIPACGVNDIFYVTEPDLRAWMMGKNPLCDYLAQKTIDKANSYARGKPWSRTIWDVAVISWFMDPDAHYMPDRFIPSPVPDEKGNWTHDPTRHSIRYVYGMYRDYLMEQMIDHLTK